MIIMKNNNRIIIVLKVRNGISNYNGTLYRNITTFKNINCHKKRYFRNGKRRAAYAGYKNPKQSQIRPCNSL